MPSVTIQGAGSVYPTLTAGTNAAIARQASSVIASAINGSVTVTGGGTVPSSGGVNSLLVVNTTNAGGINYPASYSYVVMADNPAPVTLTGGGAANEVIVLGSSLAPAASVVLNTGGGSGTIVGGDGDKTINLGATTGFAVYTGGGHDTINLTSSQIGSRSTVEAGAGSNTYNASSVLVAPGNTINLGAGTTQVRSTGSDSITAGAGSATVQVVGAVVDTVSGGAGTLTVINGTGQSRLNVSTAGVVSVPSGSTTVAAGGGGGLYAGGSSGNNLLIGSAGAVTLRGAGNGDVLITMGTSGTQVLTAGSGNETLLGSLSTTNNLFVAGSGNDLIVGGTGSDTFVAGTGAATITSGGGPDFLLLNANASAGAQITVTDFVAGVDHIRLMNYAGNNTPTALAAAATSLGAAGSRITLSDGTTITLQGIATVNSGFFA